MVKEAKEAIDSLKATITTNVMVAKFEAGNLPSIREDTSAPFQKELSEFARRSMEANPKSSLKKWAAALGVTGLGSLAIGASIMNSTGSKHSPEKPAVRNIDESARPSWEAKTEEKKDTGFSRSGQ